MLVIPAIDLRGGKCVRLRQGDYGQETVFGDDPVSMACRWVDEGAAFLHLVDLDGAKEGRPVNTAAIEGIVKKSGVPCQLGGGLRDEAGIRQAFDLGIRRVILGTKAVRDPEWLAEMATLFPEQVVLGLDAKNGKVATDGWLDVSELSVLDLARKHDRLPLAAIVYTDIAKDGMMSGPNFDATEALAKVSRHAVIASGGVTTTEDVLELRSRGIGACILGRTIYEGNIKLSDLLRRLRE
jgi:phosphoribosylformimino-5-aminoimidazole carboxamide ribotide isomerase